MQSSTPPHPSGIMPQSAFWAAHVVGRHPQRFAPPRPQVCPPAHAPQSVIAPQPSEMVPHSAPISVHVIGEHPHFFEMPPPPHVAGVTHSPQ
jgi:hypothetical protein